MIRKTPIFPRRIRKIRGSFAFIEHRFLRDGFFASLDQPERSLYLFLALASDRQGLSYYGYDKICSINGMLLEDYIGARDGLIDKDLIALGDLPQDAQEKIALRRQLRRQLRGGG